MEAPEEGEEGRSKGGKGRLMEMSKEKGREGPRSWMDQGKKAEGRNTQESALSLISHICLDCE